MLKFLSEIREELFSSTALHLFKLNYPNRNCAGSVMSYLPACVCKFPRSTLMHHSGCFRRADG